MAGKQNITPSESAFSSLSTARSDTKQTAVMAVAEKSKSGVLDIDPDGPYSPDTGRFISFTESTSAGAAASARSGSSGSAAGTDHIVLCSTICYPSFFEITYSNVILSSGCFILSFFTTVKPDLSIKSENLSRFNL